MLVTLAHGLNLKGETKGFQVSSDIEGNRSLLYHLSHTLLVMKQWMFVYAHYDCVNGKI